MKKSTTTMVPEIIISTFQSMAEGMPARGDMPAAAKMTAVIAATYVRHFGRMIMIVYIATKRIIAASFKL